MKKDVLKEFTKVNDDDSKKIIDTLKDKDVDAALEYLEKLKIVSTPTIIKIGYSEQGDFFIKCETGITRIK